MTVSNLPTDFGLLASLLAIDSPSGDEGRISNLLISFLAACDPAIKVTRVGHSIVAQRGSHPSVALFAHIDTTGFTVGYESDLIPIGSPDLADNDKLRSLGKPSEVFGVEISADGCKVKDNAILTPGSRLVFAAQPVVEGDILTAPYLDNRAGVWAALQALIRCENLVVAFTAGEELSGHGARVCARHVFEELHIAQALIADITWDTKYVHVGSGPAVSLRDATVPNRSYLDRVVETASKSGIKHQLEIESDGGSDGGHIERGAYPIDWTFVGAPEKFPHSSHEQVSFEDLRQMANLLTFLGSELTH